MNLVGFFDVTEYILNVKEIPQYADILSYL